MTDNKLKVLVEKFQCPGCVTGSDTTCGEFAPVPCATGGACRSHVPGTIVMGVGTIYSGMPKGFNRVGVRETYKPADMTRDYIPLMFYTKDEKPRWHETFYKPIWALVKDGFLFVRTFEPRIGRACIAVIKGGTLQDAPGAQNVATFFDEMD